MSKIKSGKQWTRLGRLLKLHCVGFVKIRLNKHDVEIPSLPSGQRDRPHVCQSRLRNAKNTAFKGLLECCT